MEEKPFHDQLKDLMDSFVHSVYRSTKTFPKEERYGVTSQLRRAALSVVLNYVEGYARRRPAVYKNFLEISYGSLQEAKYLIEFSKKEGYLQEAEGVTQQEQAERIGKMLWGTLRRFE